MSNVVVYGGAGALGTAIVSFFKKNGWVCILALPSFLLCIHAKH